MTNELFPENKLVTLTGDLKFRRKNNWFVTGTFCFVTGKNQKLSRALLQICKNCHGHFSFFTGIFVAFVSRAAYQFSRAKFGVFCHGHFFKITGTISKSVTGKPKNVTGKKTLPLSSSTGARLFPKNPAPVDVLWGGGSSVSYA